MIVLGLTGGIACGKSTVSNIIREMGIPIIDSDVIAREIMDPNGTVLNELKNAFGTSIINIDGTLNRKKLSSIVFKDKYMVELLNKITHPVIRNNIIDKIQFYTQSGYKFCVLDGALLIEGDFLDILDYLILVYVDHNSQLQRLIKRDNISTEIAENIINKQMSFEEKRKYASHIVDNSYSEAYTTTQVKAIINEIIGLEGSDV